MGTTLMERLTTPIPKSLRTQPRDKRGYPIPFIVMIDRFGTPQFTINDHRKVAMCLTKKLCAICGKRMTDGVWFVGGARCFLNPYGAFLDPPAHLDCATYALKVCPFLAAPRYSGRIDDLKLPPGGLPDAGVPNAEMRVVRTDFMPPARPKRFGLGLTYNVRINRPNREQLFLHVDDWVYVEWWHNGVPVNAPSRPDGEPTGEAVT